MINKMFDTTDASKSQHDEMIELPNTLTPLISSEIIDRKAFILWLKSDGYMYLKRGDSNSIFCPYNNRDDVCGSWCPHFDINVDNVQVYLSCSGGQCDIKISKLLVQIYKGDST